MRKISCTKKCAISECLGNISKVVLIRKKKANSVIEQVIL